MKNCENIGKKGKVLHLYTIPMSIMESRKGERRKIRKKKGFSSK